MNYLIGFFASILLCTAVMPFIKKIALKIKAIDRPYEAGRQKLHKKITARGGGMAIYISFVVICLTLLPQIDKRFIGLLLAGTIVLLVGLVDDIKRLSPWVKLIFQIIAACVAVAFGIGIPAITNPFGQAINLETSKWIINIGSIGLNISVFSALFSILWLVGMTNTVNFLDGLDGLSGGVAAIAATIMFFLSIGPKVNQPVTALISIILAGACIGYLFYNFYPAKIFNGDSGAYFLGMTLGILAIFSGAKLATALLVLGLPILDAIWTVIRRILHGRSPFSADRGHLHYLLLDVGLNQRQAVLIIYAFSIAFGSVALFASTNQKVTAIFGLSAIAVVMIAALGLIKFKKLKTRAKD
ncbi:MAG: MraY family glycosyltransferase [bacterium]|nr:MraY family glycosyltransferase [bacterium]